MCQRIDWVDPPVPEIIRLDSTAKRVDYVMSLSSDALRWSIVRWSMTRAERSRRREFGLSKRIRAFLFELEERGTPYR